MDTPTLKDFYEFLIPSKEEGLVVILLHQKIEKKEIDQEFTYQDIQQVVREVSSLLDISHQPHTERILRNLIRYFIDRPSGKRNKYMFSDYAERFVALIKNKLEHPYRNFPLAESFKRYSQFKADEIHSITEFKSWYEQGFNSTTKQTITGHLEALKDDSNIAIEQMNQILYVDTLTGMDLVIKFSDLFKGFGERAEQISETLKLGNVLEVEIKKVVDRFYNRLDQMKHPETDEEKSEYLIYRNEYNESENIRANVVNFFEIVNSRLALVREKVLFSSSKLRELQDNFRQQSRYKINIKKLLQLMLEKAEYSRLELYLPQVFSKKYLPIERFRLPLIKKPDFDSEKTNNLYEFTSDLDYQKSERAKIEKELDRQQKAAQWVNHYKAVLMESKILDLKEVFQTVLGKENDIQICMQVNFDIIQHSLTQNEVRLVINKTIREFDADTKIFLWDTQIRK